MDDLDRLFEIQTVDVRGVPTKVFCTRRRRCGRSGRCSAAHGEQRYLVYEDERTRSPRPTSRSRAVARWLAEPGVQQGDRVAIAMRN